MEFILYTLAGLLLYAVSDYILNVFEIRLQKRLANRSLVFFAIISVLAVSSFSVIRMLYENNHTKDPATVKAAMMVTPGKGKDIPSQSSNEKPASPAQNKANN